MLCAASLMNVSVLTQFRLGHPHTRYAAGRRSLAGFDHGRDAVLLALEVTGATARERRRPLDSKYSCSMR